MHVSDWEICTYWFLSDSCQKFEEYMHEMKITVVWVSFLASEIKMGRLTCFKFFDHLQCNVLSYIEANTQQRRWNKNKTQKSLNQVISHKVSVRAVFFFGFTSHLSQGSFMLQHLAFDTKSLICFLECYHSTIFKHLTYLLPCRFKAVM